MIGRALERLLDLDGIMGQVGRGGPKAGCGLLGISMRTAVNRLTVAAERSSSQTLKRLRQWLLIGAVLHPDGCEHRVVQQLGKRLMGDVDQNLLHDRVSATRVLPVDAWLRFASHWCRIRWLLGVGHLHQAWDRRG